MSTLEELYADYDELEAKCARAQQREETGTRIARLIGKVQHHFNAAALEEVADKIEIAELGYNPELANRSN